ncbi:polysaccharide biosynthesis C-terminal domain-containing protein [Vibrio ostreae]|uniref:Polysaccharide biosynthesis C-terminal domain-containing protein n=1 Tax=Vibrio ostreae TaxID=2841925 RepID=A0A975U969_9VIBR|nr:polysaccharide biosynthesis C-terminal domain-containing protein [Vibrio ostreae]
MAVLVNGILNYLFIPKYGANGAAIASLISFFVLFILRTEISSLIWLSFPRAKYYTITIFFIAVSIVMALYSNSRLLSELIWMLCLSLTMILSRKTLSKYINYIKHS